MSERSIPGVQELGGALSNNQPVLDKVFKDIHPIGVRGLIGQIRATLETENICATLLISDPLPVSICVDIWARDSL